MKQGANGVVRFDGNVATKTLKIEGRGRERVQRFATEVEALRRAREAGISNVVELLDAELERVPPRFRMKRYAGDIDDLLPQTKDNPTMVARLMLPVVHSLQQLAALPIPIFHRDLKPSNILYEGTDTDPKLVISDFGCAFLADPMAERMTALTRAVGATFFRAPEYTHGRVEQVNYAGDVFSIGKLLWYMCNGVAGEVFPYTLWFPAQYNLTFRCNAPSVGSLNLIIASCVAHEPTERMSYVALIDALQRLIDNPMPHSDDTERLRIMAYESQLKIQQETARAAIAQLLLVLQSDLSWLANNLKEIYAGTLLADNVDSIAVFTQPGDDLAKTLVVDNSDVAVANWNSTHARFHIHARPTTAAGLRNLPSIEIPYVDIQVVMREGTTDQWEILTIFQLSTQGLMMKVNNNEAVPYSRAQLAGFFQSMFSRIGR